MRAGGQGLGAPPSSSAFELMPAGTPALPGVALPGVALPGVALPGVALPGVALPGVARPEALDQGHASGVAHKRALTGFW